MTLPKPQPLPSPNSSPNPRQVGFSFPVAYFLYKLVCGFSFFPFLNFLALFVVMGIGVDDLLGEMGVGRDGRVIDLHVPTGREGGRRRERERCQWGGTAR